MGCYNETDGITQLPINYGDKVRVFILAYQNHEIEGSGTSYSNEIWCPLSVGIQGTYNDYGGIENIVENFDTEIIINRLKEGLVYFKGKITIENIVYELQDPVYFKLPMVKESQLGVMFVLEEIYQAMVSFDPIKAHYLSSGYKYKSYSQILKEDFKYWYETLVNKNLFDRCEFFSSDSRDRAHIPYREMLLDLHEKNTPFEDDKIQTICKSLTEFAMFNHSMHAGRKFWHPQTGKGGQHNDFNFYKHLNKAIISKIDSSEKLMEEENDCEKMDENGYFPYMLEHNQKLK